MYWADYFEAVDYKADTKKFKISAAYAVGNTRKEYETMVDNASDAIKIFLAWRKEFKDSLKAPAEQEAA